MDTSDGLAGFQSPFQGFGDGGGPKTHHNGVKTGTFRVRAGQGVFML